MLTHHAINNLVWNKFICLNQNFIHEIIAQLITLQYAGINVIPYLIDQYTLFTFPPFLWRAKMNANKLVLISGTRSRFNKAITIVASLMSFTAAAYAGFCQS